ncbi:MAG: MarR family transcriptional regulator [Pseudomonadota bacterium]
MDTPTKYALADHVCHQAYALDRALGRAYQAAFAGSGFTYSKFIVLLALDDFGPMTIGTLSAHVGVEQNSLSPLLKKMQIAGIVTRQRSKEDERQVQIEMTDLGAKVLAAARIPAAEIYAAMGLSEGEARALLNSLRDLRRAIAKVDPTPISLPDLSE